MQDFEKEETLEMPDELTTLKERADLLGITYHPSIGVEKLRDKINAHLEGTQEAETAPVVVEEEQAPTGETLAQRNVRLRKNAAKLIRVNVTCMNPAKKEWEGEIFTAGNSIVGTYKKYVPFNTEDGWHVPQIILNQILQRKCQVFYSAKDDRGNKIRKGKQIKEFAVDILPPLTPEELKDLAQRQAMGNTIG